MKRFTCLPATLLLLSLLSAPAMAWGPYSHWAIGLEAQARAQQDGLDAKAFMAGLCAPDVLASMETQGAGALDALAKLLGAPPDAEAAKWGEWARIGTECFHGQNGLQLAQKLLELSAGNADLHAFAMGWVCHLQADVALDESELPANEAFNLNRTKIVKGLFDAISAQGLSPAFPARKWPQVPSLAELFAADRRYPQLVLQAFTAVGGQGLSEADLVTAAKYHAASQETVWKAISSAPRADTLECMKQTLAQNIIAIESLTNPKLAQMTCGQAYDKYFGLSVERALAVFGAPRRTIWAALFGCAGYAKVQGLGDRPSSVANIEMMQRVLQTCCGVTPDHISVDLHEVNGGGADLTPALIKERIGELAAKACADDLVIIYYCGHGGWTGRDCTLWLDGPEVYPADLAADLRQLKSRETLVILDSCHSGGFASQDGPCVSHESGHRVRVLGACGAKESAKGQPLWPGTFLTLFLVRALEGGPDNAIVQIIRDLGVKDFQGLPLASDANNDGHISLQEAFRWAQLWTGVASGARQVPVMCPEVSPPDVPDLDLSVPIR